MTKYELKFDPNLTNIYIDQGKDRFKLKNFFVDEQRDLLRLGYLPPVMRSTSSPLTLWEDAPDDRGHIILIERKPWIGAITVLDLSKKKGPATTFPLPIPWQHYFITLRESEDTYTLDNVGLYFSATQLTSLEHVFYTPFLPSVTGSGNLESLSNLSLFNDFDYKMADNAFSLLFEEVLSIVWGIQGYIDEPLDSLYDFIQDYGFHPELELEEVSLYDKMLAALSKLSTIKLDDILDPKVFRSLRPAFTFGNYLKYLTDVTEDTNFDFKAALEKALANRKKVELPSLKEYGLSQKKKMSWNTLEYGASQVVTTQQAYTVSANWTTNLGVFPGSVTWTGNTTSSLTHTEQLANLMLEDLYQDSKKRWRRVSDGTYASKSEIALKKEFA